VTEETPDEIVIEKNDDSGEHEEPETENSKDSEEEPPAFEFKTSGRPYVRYQSAGRPRTGSIWNSPIGLITVFFLASKGIDLAYRVFMEREKTKRAENQNQK